MTEHTHTHNSKTKMFSAMHTMARKMAKAKLEYSETFNLTQKHFTMQDLWS